jgi:RNA polymerase sigma-70 factor, ECF subfamily
MSGAPRTSRDITLWLANWRNGDAKAGDRLADAVYPELRQIAARFLNNERAGHTLEPNALVHELWMRLVGGDPVLFQNRAHFFALSAQTMRRTLIDYARARIRGKRGGEQQQVSLTAVDGWNPVERDEDLLDLDQALSKLERADPRAARVVVLRFFGGLEEEEVAEALGVSVITVKRDWKVARAWLMNRLANGRQPVAGGGVKLTVRVPAQLQARGTNPNRKLTRE